MLADGRVAKEVARREPGGGAVPERTWELNQMEDDVVVGKGGLSGRQENLLKNGWVGSQEVNSMEQ